MPLCGSILQARTHFKLMRWLGGWVGGWVSGWFQLHNIATSSGIEKVLYPGILVTSQFQIWQPIFGWAESQASPPFEKPANYWLDLSPGQPSSISKEPISAGTDDPGI